MSDRYNVESDAERLGYQFFTTAGDLYTAYFTDFFLTTADGEELVVPMFGFDRVKSPRAKGQGIEKDEKVKCTLQHIVAEYFRNHPEDGILYLCFSGDGKQAGRSAIFTEWIEEMGGVYVKYDSPEVYAKDKLHGSLIMLEANPGKDKYVSAFYNSIETWMGG